MLLRFIVGFLSPLLYLSTVLRFLQRESSPVDGMLGDLQPPHRCPLPAHIQNVSAKSCYYPRSQQGLLVYPQTVGKNGRRITESRKYVLLKNFQVLPAAVQDAACSYQHYSPALSWPELPCLPPVTDVTFFHPCPVKVFALECYRPKTG